MTDHSIRRSWAGCSRCSSATAPPAPRTWPGGSPTPPPAWQSHFDSADELVALLRAEGAVAPSVDADDGRRPEVDCGRGPHVRVTPRLPMPTVPRWSSGPIALTCRTRRWSATACPWLSRRRRSACCTTWRARRAAGDQGRVPRRGVARRLRRRRRAEGLRPRDPQGHRRRSGRRRPTSRRCTAAATGSWRRSRW